MVFDWNYFAAKLTSRKFWAAITGFVTAVLIMAKVDDGTITQIVALIGAFSVLVAYIVGEGLVDAAGAGATVVHYYGTEEIEH